MNKDKCPSCGRIPPRASAAHLTLMANKVDAWNKLHPVGSKVVVTKDNGELFETKTRSAFRMRITALRDEWIEGVITDGVATARMCYNVKDAGQTITVRDVHSYFIPL